jgi:hypothetical protein
MIVPVGVSVVWPINHHPTDTVLQWIILMIAFLSTFVSIQYVSMVHSTRYGIILATAFVSFLILFAISMTLQWIMLSNDSNHTTTSPHHVESPPLYGVIVVMIWCSGISIRSVANLWACWLVLTRGPFHHQHQQHHSLQTLPLHTIYSSSHQVAIGDIDLNATAATSALLTLLNTSVRLTSCHSNTALSPDAECSICISELFPSIPLSSSSLSLPPKSSIESSISISGGVGGSNDATASLSATGDGVCMLQCGHAYHVQCVRVWISMGRFTCPVCRGAPVAIQCRQQLARHCHAEIITINNNLDPPSSLTHHIPSMPTFDTTPSVIHDINWPTDNVDHHYNNEMVE